MDKALKVKAAKLYPGEKVCAEIVWIDVMDLMLMEGKELETLLLYQKSDIARIVCDG